MRQLAQERNLSKTVYAARLFTTLVACLLAIILAAPSSHALAAINPLPIVQDTAKTVLATPPVPTVLTLVAPSGPAVRGIIQPESNPNAAPLPMNAPSSQAPPAPPPSISSAAPLAASNTAGPAFPPPVIAAPPFASVPLLTSLKSTSQEPKPGVSTLAGLDKSGNRSGALAGILQPSERGWLLFGIAWYWWLLLALPLMGGRLAGAAVTRRLRQA